MKPKQDYRFDVPVIGERTIKKLAEADIRTAVLEAEQTLILESDIVKGLAEKNGIRIFGL